jgi:phosphotransferase system enzyme I (PtsI)
MPSEDEQFEAYRTVVKGMGGRPITIRTFDLGNDKDLHPATVHGDRMREQSGAWPASSIRLSLAEPKMFQAQLRAILRARSTARSSS